MTPAFGIGEKALLKPCAIEECVGGAAKYFGTEVIVLTALLPTPNAEGGYAYDIRAFDGRLLFAIPSALQKLPPPAPNWKAIAMRDELVKGEKVPARVPHPAIVSLLQLVGQEIAL